MPVRMYGDWNNVMPRIVLLGQRLNSEGREYLERKGQEFIDMVSNHIREQDLSFTPLSPETIAKKGNEMYWYETGTFLKKLSVTKVKKSLGVVEICAGALDKVEYKDGMTMFDIAMKLEMGTSTIPGRPLFQRTLLEFEKSFGDMEETIAKKLRIISGGL